VDGNAITVGTDYTILVMTVGNNATGDAMATGSSITTDVSDATIKEANIYTNGNTLYFQNVETGGKLEVLNSLGTIVHNGEIGSGSSSLPLNNLSDGVYTVRVITNGITTSKKVSLMR